MKAAAETKDIFPTRMGFEPTRAEHIGLAVQRLNHSATSSMQQKSRLQHNATRSFCVRSNDV